MPVPILEQVTLVTEDSLTAQRTLRIVHDFSFPGLEFDLPRKEPATMRTYLLPLILLTSVLAISVFARDSHPHTGTTSSISQFHPYIEYLGEFSHRRKANVYFQNSQSIFNGAQIGFVNVGSGNATFIRRDLVTAGRIPIVVARTYDSAASGSTDFGPGWKFAGAETIEVSKEHFAHLTSENGSVLTFVEDGGNYRIQKSFPTDIVTLDRAPNGNLVLKLRNGFRKEYGLIHGLYRLQRVSDRNGNELRLLYSDGLIVRLENQGHFVAVARNSEGRVLSVADDAGRSVAYQYDSQGRLAAVKDLGGNQWVYAYTGLDRLHIASDPEGRVNFKVWYQSDGRVRALELPSGKISYNYDVQSHTTTVIDRKNLISRYVQNAEGITTRITNSLGETSEIVLDSDRNVAKVVRNGQTAAWTFGYDSQHRLLSSSEKTDDGLLEATYEYDPGSGLLTSIMYGNGTERSFAYDAVGNLLSDSNGKVSQFSYSAQGDLLGFSHEGTILTLKSDPDGLVASIDNGESSATFSYGSGGRLTDGALSKGIAVHTTYNALGLRKRLDFSDGRKLEYSFDAAANLVNTKFTTLDGQTTGQTMILDNSYQLIKQILGNGRINTFKYDANGNLLYADLATGAVSFEYDSLNRLTAVITPQGIRLQYSYQPGEPSLVTRAHGGEYGGEWSGRIDTGTVYLAQSEALDVRAHNAVFGTVGFSEGLGEFQVAIGDGGEMMTGEAQVERIVENLRFSDALDPKGEKSFLAPSNPLYLPGEYANMNCCICGSGGAQLPCDYCYPDPPPPPTISGPNTVWWFSGATPSGYNTSITLTSSGGSATTWAVTAGANEVTLSSTSGASITVESSGTAFSSSGRRRKDNSHGE